MSLASWRRDYTGREALEQFTRKLPTPNEGKIFRLGLSPWSFVTRCDVCANVRPYMDTQGIDHDTPLFQVGRWMMHEACTDEALQTLQMPKLNYGPLMSLPAPARLAIMKMQLQRVKDDALDEARA